MFLLKKKSSLSKSKSNGFEKLCASESEEEDSQSMRCSIDGFVLKRLHSDANARWANADNNNIIIISSSSSIVLDQSSSSLSSLSSNSSHNSISTKSSFRRRRNISATLSDSSRSISPPPVSGSRRTRTQQFPDEAEDRSRSGRPLPVRSRSEGKTRSHQPALDGEMLPRSKSDRTNIKKTRNQSSSNNKSSSSRPRLTRSDGSSDVCKSRSSSSRRVPTKTRERSSSKKSDQSKKDKSKRRSRSRSRSRSKSPRRGNVMMQTDTPYTLATLVSELRSLDHHPNHGSIRSKQSLMVAVEIDAATLSQFPHTTFAYE